MRRPLPEHLPREVRTYPPKQEACPDCGGELKHLGEDVSEILEYVPARFKVIRQVRPKLACACCERIVQAAAPSRPIERGIAGPGLLAHVLVSKYCDHLPLYRQSEIYAREGVELERSTLADWVGGTSAVARAAGGSAAASRDGRDQAARRRHAGSGAGARKWKNKNRDGCGRMCATTVLRETQHQRRFGSPTRRIARASIRRRISAILRARCRRMVTRDSMRCTKPGAFRKRPVGHMCAESFTICTSRINRRSLPKRSNASPRCMPSKKKFAATRRTSGARSARTQARPLLDSLKQWLEETLGKLSRKSDTALAVRYALSRWDALLRYVDDGRIEIDNNAAERSLRTVALGRKNYLFAGSDAGGERAAAIYSLIGSRQTQRSRSRSLSPQRVVPHRRPSDQPHRGTPALERRAGIRQDIRQRRLTNPAPCQHGQGRTLTLMPLADVQMSYYDVCGVGGQVSTSSHRWFLHAGRRDGTSA